MGDIVTRLLATISVNRIFIDTMVSLLMCHRVSFTLPKFRCNLIRWMMSWQVSELNKQIDRFKTSEEEAKLKLRSKEEMAAAAIAARTAAERSLQMADERAGEMRERLEELNKLIEESDRNKDYRLGLGWLDTCCPWLRDRRRSSDRGGTQMAAEMEELLEPLV